MLLVEIRKIVEYGVVNDCNLVSMNINFNFISIFVDLTILVE